MNPKVSIIIPSYNDSKNLLAALQSVFLQSYKDVEVIVVDDGSDIDTKKVLSDYIESGKIIYLYQQRNGVNEARRNGVSISKGEYIAFLDSDDLWVDEDKIKKQIEFLDNNKDYVLVGTGVINVDEDRREINRYLMCEKDEMIRKKMLRINCFVNSSVLFRKKYFVSCSLPGGLLEDYELWLNFGKVGKLDNLPIYAVKYTMKPDGYGSYNKIARLKENLALSKKYKNAYPHYFRALLLGKIKIYLYPIFQILPLNVKAFLLKIHKRL